MEKSEADQLRCEAKQGLFDQLIAVTRTNIQQRSFRASERAVSEHSPCDDLLVPQMAKQKRSRKRLVVPLRD